MSESFSNFKGALKMGVATKYAFVLEHIYPECDTLLEFWTTFFRFMFQFLKNTSTTCDAIILEQ